jgi:hypothetical protein
MLDAATQRLSSPGPTAPPATLDVEQPPCDDLESSPLMETPRHHGYAEEKEDSGWQGSDTTLQQLALSPYLAIAASTAGSTTTSASPAARAADDSAGAAALSQLMAMYARHRASESDAEQRQKAAPPTPSTRHGAAEVTVAEVATAEVKTAEEPASRPADNADVDLLFFGDSAAATAPTSEAREGDFSSLFPSVPAAVPALPQTSSVRAKDSDSRTQLPC